MAQLVRRAVDETPDEKYTPADKVALARLVLGRIDLDPASCPEANAVVKARRYYTIKQDGLRRRWRARTLFLNCPYKRGVLPWVDKLLRSFDAGDVLEAIALFNMRSSSRWFHALAPRAWRCEPWSRVRFWGPGTSGGNGMQDQVWFYLGPNPDRFRAVFELEGRLVGPSVTLGVTRRCMVCGRSLAGMRADAETCGAACRQRRHREKATK